MHRSPHRFLVLLSALLALPASAEPMVFEDAVLPMIDANCLDCHDGDAGKPKGGVDLAPIFSGETAQEAGHKFWEKVYTVLAHEQMPPVGESQPDAEEKEAAIAWIEQAVWPSALGDQRDPGRPVLRRLSRLEYNNTMRDLLGLKTDLFMFPERLNYSRDYFDPSLTEFPDELEVNAREYGQKVPTLLPAASLPADNRAAHGFMNRGDVMNVSPLLLENYLQMATEVVHTPGVLQQASALRAAFPPEALRDANARQRDLAESPRSGVSATAVAETKFAPESTVHSTAEGTPWSLEEFRKLLTRKSGSVLHEPEEPGAQVAGNLGGILRFEIPDREGSLVLRPGQDLWFAGFGTAEETSGGILGANQQRGEKLIEMDLESEITGQGIDDLGLIILSRSKGAQGVVKVTVASSDGGTQTLQADLKEGAGVDNTFFGFSAPEGAVLTWLQIDGSQFEGDYVLFDDLAVTLKAHSRMPERSPSFEEITADSGTFRPLLAKFMQRAFRRPVSEDEAGLYHGLYERALESGISEEQAIRESLRAVMASPQFLFLVESHDPEAGPVRPATGLELASRLSYFLWASMPDEALLEAALEGRLDTEEGLEAEVHRMMADPKVKEFTESFTFQWLQLNELLGSQPDARRFDDYYFGPSNKRTLTQEMLVEPILFLETVLVENRPITEFIDSDWLWLNHMLVDFYDLEEAAPGFIERMAAKKQGRDSVWIRVPLPDRRRGGVLTMGSVLTLTSTPLRTSPVYRGSWMTEVVFNRPPPPPPAAVDELGEDDEAFTEEGLTLREITEAHRNETACAGCHKLIDPLGFPLENFNAIGQWRDHYSGDLPIDASGDLYERQSYEGPIAFKDALLREKEVFAHGFVRHLLSYALGRELTVADEQTVREILEATAPADYRLEDVILAVVKSYPFRNLRNVPETPDLTQSTP